MRQLKIAKQVTNRDEKSLEKYFQEISKIGLITADEEVELALKIKKGDGRALDKLVKANLRFVVSVAKQYQGQGLKLSDLINEGNLGLVKAAKRFDETRGFKFISYAVWWIRQSIMSALAEQSRIVRLPLNKIGSISKIKKVYSKLEQQNERIPTYVEIANELDTTVSSVTQSMKNSGKHLSMDAPFKDGEDTNLYNVLKTNEFPRPDKKLMKESLNTDIERALNILTQKEAKVIKMFFGLGNYKPTSLSEIGETFDLTRERVRQVKQRAIKRLKNKYKTEVLRYYLG
ncbi:RNA polymerase sigma factor RpoD/SigA [Polaribacter vadi]|uniref:sigma-70 family RNA polymerase sigma factor n=1 Tax=Polaribacter TaxID=52959 RepID=UPI001C0A1402|nr:MULTISPECIES: RNA polymerase sigma factor RpoD/SigA [Polaribacter]MBU3011083.1 RNA polymerase sigma factor RpoD/SigA [Polaribacter vadi]MDO6740897.1 RNA polymerase sigma factor RpoD/SigA [Polaribacter sp. 1_MG-2023]